MGEEAVRGAREGRRGRGVDAAERRDGARRFLGSPTMASLLPLRFWWWGKSSRSELLLLRRASSTRGSGRVSQLPSSPTNPSLQRACNFVDSDAEEVEEFGTNERGRRKWLGSGELVDKVGDGVGVGRAGFDHVRKGRGGSGGGREGRCCRVAGREVLRAGTRLDLLAVPALLNVPFCSPLPLPLPSTVYPAPPARVLLQPPVRYGELVRRRRRRQEREERIQQLLPDWRADGRPGELRNEVS